ncbi:peptidylprolyl isomerase [Robbsia andropogonis]|uniref:peptidylprolyl isomerase n=1 Tax=Robbsia andropogonis TaxID=28092 RepID=UPI0004648E2D
MIFSKTRVATAAAFTLVAVSMPAFAQNAAIVNGTAIPSARVDAMIQTLPEGSQSASPQLREIIRDELINREVLMQAATKDGLTKDPVVQQQMAIAAQTVVIRAYLEKYVATHPASDAELHALYDSIAAKMKAQSAGKEYHLHHILVDNEQQAKDLIAKIKGGANFEDLAKQFSKDTGSAKNGGDLPWSPANAYVPEFAKAAEALKDGQVTDTPVHTQFGWHIIRLDGERDAQAPALPPFDSVKSQLAQQAQKQQIEDLESKLRGQAKIQ